MVSISKSRVKARNPYTAKEKQQLNVLGVVLAVLLGCLGLLKLTASNDTTAGGGTLKARLKQVVNDHRPHLKLDESKSSPMLSEAYNAMAQDILSTLDCETLMNKTATNTYGQERYDDDAGMGGGRPNDDGNNNNNNNQDVAARRRLQATDDGDDSVKQQDLPDGDTEDGGEGGEEGPPMYDDFAGDYRYYEVNAKEAFCLAAATTTISEEMLNATKRRVSCDASGTKQMAILDLWSEARSQMSQPLLLKTLELATESQRSLGTHSVNLWAPRSDDGMNFILSQVNDLDETARKNGNNFYGLSNNLGPGHLFVDVGSCLGITTLAVILEYPHTEVVSIEPAAPNWFMQELNMRCNLEEDQQPNLLLAGVGPHNKETMTAKLLWRPSSVTATRAWTPAEEQVPGEDEELFVQLRPWKKILTEAGIHGARHIDVLHVDCEGCEYNLIPALSDAEYDSIDTVMGEVHWGYIPEHKLPSSKRGQMTHDRLCQHENFARTAKECCGSPDLQVRSFNPGEVLYRDGAGNEAATVKDLSNEGLCDDFSDWVEEHHYYEIDNDYGWFEISSVAK